MYIKGSKWNMSRKRQRSNPFRVILLVLVIAGVFAADRFIVPTVPALFMATPTITRPPESYITDAQKLEGEGRLTLAINAYKQAVEVDPKNPANYIALARLYIYTGSYSDAVTQAENALLLNPANDTAMALRGWALSFEGDYIQAEASLKDAIATNPQNAAAVAYLSEVYIDMVQDGQGQLDTSENAIAYSKQAVEMAPGAIETHRARGLVLEYTGNYEEAVTEFEAAIAINPNIADLHLALGRNYYYLLEYDQAITEYTKANSLNPKDSAPETLIANVYMINGDYTKAAQYAEAALQDNPVDPYLYGNLGAIYFRQAYYQDAVDVLRIAVQGGTTSDGRTIKGLSMDYGKAGTFYYTYGLALADVGQCSLALQIAQAVATGMRNDDTAVYNAQEIINVCEQLAKQGATEVPTATEGAYIIEPTATPEALSTSEVMPTETPTP